jgi:hypothetical protein
MPALEPEPVEQGAVLYPRQPGNHVAVEHEYVERGERGGVRVCPRAAAIQDRTPSRAPRL